MILFPTPYVNNLICMISMNSIFIVGSTSRPHCHALWVSRRLTYLLCYDSVCHWPVCALWYASMYIYTLEDICLDLYSNVYPYASMDIGLLLTYLWCCPQLFCWFICIWPVHVPSINCLAIWTAQLLFSLYMCLWLSYVISVLYIFRFLYPCSL